MGADNFLVFAGVRQSLGTDDDSPALRELHDRRSPRMVAFRRAKVHHWWGREQNGGEYFLLLGRKVGAFGWEGLRTLSHTPAELTALFAETQRVLAEVGIHEPVGLHLQAVLDG